MKVRVRQRGSRSSGPLATVTYSTRGPATPAYYAATRPTWTDSYAGGGFVDNTEFMTDVVESGYRPGLSPRNWVNNPMTQSKKRLERNVLSTSGDCTPPNAYGQYLNVTWAGDWFSYFLGPIAEPDGTTLINESNVIGIASIDALKKVESPQSQSLVTAAELGKSLTLIAERSRQLARVIEACRKGKSSVLRRLLPGVRRDKQILTDRHVVWDGTGAPLISNGKVSLKRYRYTLLDKKGLGTLDKASQLWLEYRYGWRTLVFDIVDTLKAIHADQLRKELIQHDVITRRGVSNASNKSSSSAVTTSGTRKFTVQTDLTEEISVRAYVSYEVAKDAGLTRRLNDFGVFDVPRAAWELVPMSFIVDWFVPVGDWLLAMTPKVGVNILTSGYTVTRKCVRVRRLTAFQWTGTIPAGHATSSISPMGIGSYDSCTFESKQRVVGLSVPVFPPVSVHLNASRLADAISLLKGTGVGRLRV